MPKINIPEPQVQPLVTQKEIRPEIFGDASALRETAKILEDTTTKLQNITDYKEVSTSELGLNAEIARIQEGQVSTDKSVKGLKEFEVDVDKAVNDALGRISNPIARVEAERTFSMKAQRAKHSMGNIARTHEINSALDTDGLIFAQEQQNYASAANQLDMDMAISSIEARIDMGIEKGLYTESAGQLLLMKQKDSFVSARNKRISEEKKLLDIEKAKIDNDIQVKQGINTVSIYSSIVNAKTVDEKKEALRQIDIREGMESVDPGESITSSQAADLRKLVLLPDSEKAAPSARQQNLLKVEQGLLSLYENADTITVEDVDNFLSETNNLVINGQVGKVDKQLQDAILLKDDIFNRRAVDKLRAARVGFIGGVKKIIPFFDFITDEQIDETKGKIIEEYYKQIEGGASPEKAYEDSVLDVMSPLNPYYQVFKGKNVGDKVTLPDGKSVIYRGFVNGEIHIDEAK